MTMRIVAAFCASASFMVAAAGRQEVPRPRPQTAFKSAVDLVPVDVNVLDRDGRPIDNLTTQDFALTVDGKPRRLVSAEFVRTVGQTAPPRRSPYYSSNAQAGTGRLVMLVIDQGNISDRRGRAATESAIRFIKRLTPADRVGLFAIPGPGPQINFTSNHALIQAQLPRIVGHAGTALGPQRVGLGEAARVDRGDQTTLNAVADRECSGTDRSICMQELATEAREIFGEARARTRSSLGALHALMERLSDDRAQKTVVYLSEGLVIDDHSELAWLGPLAAKGRVALHILRIDASASDASSSRSSSSRREDAALAEESLSTMAGLARGSLFRVLGNADSIFNRLALEMSGYYLLGFEPEAGDRDGKTHKIKIDVPGRRDVEIRARQDFNIEAPRVQTDEEAVAETLRAPLQSGDIGLKVTTYTFRAPDSQKLRILIAADIDRSQNPSGRVALGYALLDATGRVVSSQYDARVKAPVRTETETQQFVAAAIADAPGVYALKLAVVDDMGRRGSVEHSFKAQLTPAGPVRTADLMIGEGARAATEGTAPTVAGDFVEAEELHGYLELYADSADALNVASVTIEVAAREDARALDSVAARLEASTAAADTTSPTARRVAEGVLTIALLPPGEYVARAVVSVGGRKAGQIVRPFRIVRSSTVAPSGGASRGRARSRGNNPFAVSIDSFERSAVLTPQVVGFFLDRMSAVNRTAPPAAAVEHARAGRFEAALDSARQSGNQLAVAFLQGMALYARGDLEAAAVKFRDAIRIDSEFFPAAFYLGACYAAGGRDRDASAAWQTSLVGEGDAPFIYALLGDSLLRQREIDQAVTTLKEASALWPDDPQVQRRLGTALAMAGKPADALRILDAYLVKNPADPVRLFVALRIIYEAHAGGRTIGAGDEDRRMFDRYAAAYVAAGGPQLTLVEQWKKFMARR